MARIEPFENYSLRYEHWFEENEFVYRTELRAVKALLPSQGRGIEIGVGSGRFAAPLGIRLGIEPSDRMSELAKKRGIEVVKGVAENLPLKDAKLEFALMVTTICFVSDISKSFREAHRILKPNGSLIIGFVDKDSPIGESYLQHKDKSLFYNIATFYSVNEVIHHLTTAGFKDFTFVQTVFHSLPEIKSIEPMRNGYGNGSFVVVRARK